MFPLRIRAGEPEPDDKIVVESKGVGQTSAVTFLLDSKTESVCSCFFVEEIIFFYKKCNHLNFVFLIKLFTFNRQSRIHFIQFLVIKYIVYI